MLLSQNINESVVPEITVWYGNFKNYNSQSVYFRSILSDIELIRLNKFPTHSLKQSYIISHGVMRVLLGNAISLPPQQISYFFNKYDKPFIIAQNCSFNLSHTPNFFCIAIANNVQLGVDIEETNRNFDWELISKRFFSDAENAFINSFSIAERTKAFIKTWTRKEAILKALGCGIVNDLKAIESVSDIYVPNYISLSNECELDVKPTQLHLQTFEIENMLISVAASNNLHIKVREFEM